MITIRRATMDDAFRIAEIEKDCFTDPWTLDAVQSEFTGHHDARYYAAEDSGLVIAYAGVWVVRPEGYITNVAVHPLYRREGIARSILRKLIADCEADGVTDITLEVRVSNGPAISLYQGLGFESAGIRANYYRDGEDAFIMWRRQETEIV